MNAATRCTQDLLAPAGAPVDDGDRLRIRDRLAAAIPPLVERLPHGQEVVVTLPLLRTVGIDPGALGRPEEPFAWKSVFVRRSLGLAVVDACAGRRFRTPAEAIEPVAAGAVSEWERTGWRTFHWEPWLAGLAPGARAVVLADALTWATALWSSLDWAAFGAPPQIGGVDDQWICPARRTMRLKGRAELRVPLGAARRHGRPGLEGSGSATALVSVSAGSPGARWAEELAYLGLVAGLRCPTRPVPTRVVGLWPDAGMHSSVEIDGEVLGTASDRVVATVAAVVDARISASLAA